MPVLYNTTIYIDVATVRIITVALIQDRTLEHVGSEEAN
jgi:hypothetical protein